MHVYMYIDFYLATYPWAIELVVSRSPAINQVVSSQCTSLYMSSISRLCVLMSVIDADYSSSHH